jgi:hypothetical protein
MMDAFLTTISPFLPILLSGVSLFGGYRIYQEFRLRSSRGTTKIVGNAAGSLNDENFRINKSARAKGIEGELGVAEVLNDLASKFGLVALHDLSIPGSRANIDHILIQSRVVFVIDAKNYAGTVNIKKDSRGIWQLYVGGSKQTALAQKLKDAAENIEDALLTGGFAIKIVPLLAFYKSKFHEDSRYSINGVSVNVSGIKNELLRFSSFKGREFDSHEIAELLLQKFPLKS